MKKILTTIFLILMILTVAGVAFTPQPVEASSCLPVPGFFSASGCVAEIGNIAMGLVSVLLSLAGVLLNVSMNLTVNIKSLYEATPAIGNIWVIIRNISSMFIIFMLLYTSIQTILGTGNPNIKGLIGKIILAGLLINFSLFFTKVAIDASNLISLQFYKAIAPEYSAKAIPGSTISDAFNSGGLSNVFMQSLKIQKIYDPGNSGIQGVKDEGKIIGAIIVASYGGVILMLFATISFLAAAIAFSIRTGLLLILMAFSPIYFAGMIFPTIQKEVSGKWMKYLTNQLLFMPVYLLLMYVAMRIISDAGFMSFLQTKEGITSGSFFMKQAGIAIQYFIAIFFINLPLIGALEFGAIGTKFAENMTKGLKERIYKQPGYVSGVIGRNTAGRLGSKFDKYLENTPIGNSQFGRSLRASTTQNLANAKWGSSESRKDVEKQEKEIKKKGREIENLKALKIAIAAGNHAEIKSRLGNMSNSEISGLDKDILANEHVVQHVSSAVYSNIEKSDKSDKDKVAIREARTKQLTGAVGAKDKAKIKDIMKNMTGEDLQTYIENNPTTLDDELIAHIRPSQLKDMDGMDDILRKQIGDSIDKWNTKYSTNHASYKFINDNRGAWTT